MRKAVRYMLAGLAGATVGYFSLVVVANLEDRKFYTVRSFVTGHTVPSEIAMHPADRLVVPVLLAVFVIGGAVAGVLAAKRFGSSASV